MVDLMLAGDEREIRARKAIRTVYDPCCGSGGMLMITKEHITVGLRRNGDVLRPAINPGAEIHLFVEEIEADIRGIEHDILRMLAEVRGRPA